MRLNVYDTFEDYVEMTNLAKQLQSEGMESMKEPHLWATEPIKTANVPPLFSRLILETV